MDEELKKQTDRISAGDAADGMAATGQEKPADAPLDQKVGTTSFDDLEGLTGLQDKPNANDFDCKHEMADVEYRLKGAALIAICRRCDTDTVAAVIPAELLTQAAEDEENIGAESVLTDDAADDEIIAGSDDPEELPRFKIKLQDDNTGIVMAVGTNDMKAFQSTDMKKFMRQFRQNVQEAEKGIAQAMRDGREL
jgi:hypothetical protein